MGSESVWRKGMHAALDKGISRRTVILLGKQGSRGVVMRWVKGVVEGSDSGWAANLLGERECMLHWIKESVEGH